MHKIVDYLTSKEFMEMLLMAGLKVLGALLLLVVGIWLCARIANLFRRTLTRAEVDVTLVVFLRNLTYGILVVLLLVATLQLVGVPSASLVAAVGAAGLAIGLSLQGSLSNLAWGVLLIVFRPFRAGDLVNVGGQTGTVESISLMYTTLVTLDNQVAVIPNSKVGSDAIININARDKRRAEIKMRLPYSVDVDKAMQVIRQTFDEDARVLKDPEPAIFVVGLDDGNVELSARAWANTPDYWGMYTDLNHAVKRNLNKAGIRMAPPQREILMRQPDSD